MQVHVDVVSLETRHFLRKSRDPVIYLCRLAFHGIKTNKVTFSDSNLTGSHCSLYSKKYMSLKLHAYAWCSASVPVKIVYFCFLHLISIQELLAEVNISQMYLSSKSLIYMCSSTRSCLAPRIQSSILKLRTQPWLSLLSRLLCPVFISTQFGKKNNY